MVFFKNPFDKVLIFLMFFIVFWIGNGFKVSAEILTGPEYFERNGEQIGYYYTDKEIRIYSDKNIYTIQFDRPVYVIPLKIGDTVSLIHLSYDAYSYNVTQHATPDANGSTSTKYYNQTYSENGRTVYFGDFRLSSMSDCSLKLNYSDNNVDDIKFAFRWLACQDKFDDLQFIPPDFSKAVDFSMLQIKGFSAEIVNDNLTASWDGVYPVFFNDYETGIIWLEYSLTSLSELEEPLEPITKYWRKKFKFNDNQFTIPMSALVNIDGYYLSSIKLTPSCYENDDLTKLYYIGNSTRVTFTEDQQSSKPLIVPPSVDDLVEDDVQKGIYYSITGFFSSYFGNLLEALKAAFVPDPDDIVELLEEMDDWFSVKLGFLYYPFDLMIDIVEAFALGEANEYITVPSYTLNMFNGVKLWDEFQIHLNPLGFLQYVRFFTSAIMCCGTVSLAIKKWDSWIGGRN